MGRNGVQFLGRNSDEKDLKMEQKLVELDRSETVEWSWRRWAVRVYAWRHSGQPPASAIGWAFLPRDDGASSLAKRIA